MSMRTVNLDTYSLSLLTAKEDIVNPRSSTNWALFTYDGVSNKLKLADSGVGGVAELAGKFHVSKPQYGLCRVGSAETGGHRIAMISWVGQNVDDYRRTECASHIPAIKNFFKEAHAFISAEKVEDLTEEKITAELSKTQAQAPTQWVRRSSRSVDKEDIVGTNYRKTNAAMEMRLINRDSFWARAEREEEQRKEEERRRASEERRRLERERVLKDRKDAEERDRKMNEKLQMIEEQRRKQAEQEEMQRRKEKLRWEQEQREHEEDMRARLRRSESIEKAAEAAVLVSQRSMNPREFFRQLSSSSSQSPTSPGTSRTGKPFRRYQRSLTDTAFIFAKAEESMASSPHSSPLVSPFSRAPPSPFYRATSPPTSPNFRPVTSPQRPKAPMSPPTSHVTSPHHSDLPVSALPVVPPPNRQVQPSEEPKAPSPTEPSAPPASPSLLASLSASLEKNNPSHPEAPPSSPSNTPIELECSTFCFESGLAPQAPTAPLPERPQPNTELHTATNVHTELVSDTGYKVQAVLVEEEEEDEVEENEEEKAETQLQPCVFTTEPVETEAEEQEQVEEKYEQVKEKDEQMEKDDQVEEKDDHVEENDDQVEDKDDQVEEKDDQVEENDDQVEEKDDQVEENDDQVEENEQQEKYEQQQEEEEEEEEGSKHEAEPASLEEPEKLFQEEEEEKEEEEEEEEKKEDREQNDQSEDSQGPTEPAELLQKEEEPSVTDAEPIHQEIKHETVVLSTNGITNGDNTQQQNGIERSLSLSDTELSSPELGVCYDLHGTAEEDDVNEVKEQEISENGQEVSAEPQMCVRALYDYQAEDESEISFEPGDIIRDVETVDKAWWRGWSKDGRQGLFPANYVETI
ncbi:hypothetical protein PAMP_022456 [Pampus punctatissimus]